MSVITLQIGQCGNQIGEKLYDTILNDCFNCSTLFLNSKTQAHYISNHHRQLNEYYINESLNRFFTENENLSNYQRQNFYARSILIDMESKVVNKLLNEKNLNMLNYRPKNAYTQKKGSGNNW